MNEDRVIGRWHQWVGQAKESWGLLTHDGAVAHAGRRERLSGVIRQRYGQVFFDSLPDYGFTTRISDVERFFNV